MDAIVARLAWLVLQSDAGSRYDAPLWVWIVVAVAAVGLSLAGLFDRSLVPRPARPPRAGLRPGVRTGRRGLPLAGC